MKAAIESLDPSFQEMINSAPLLNKWSMPHKGVYLFSEKEIHLYVGRSNNIPKRYNAHASRSALHNQAAFAMLLAREETNFRATYKSLSRPQLMNDPVFRPAFDKAKLRIARMEFRAISETDQTRQALLEIHVAVALGTRYNDFGTH